MTAKTPAQRKAAERQRKTEQGLAEVRGIWAPPERHAEIRKTARLMLKPSARKVNAK